MYKCVLKMKFILTKKDIIALNQEFDEGVFHNEQSLSYALSYASKSDNWIKALSFLVRAILVDHVFQDGNKRTSALLIKAYAEFEGHNVYGDKLVNFIKEAVLRNITDLSKMENMIRDVIK